MKCRAGITTRPDERKLEWKNKYPSMTNWQLHGPFGSRIEAQIWENRQFQCEKSPGGNDPDNPKLKWYGYSFNY
jgi:hypothetical protein